MKSSVLSFVYFAFVVSADMIPASCILTKTLPIITVTHWSTAAGVFTALPPSPTIVFTTVYDHFCPTGLEPTTYTITKTCESKPCLRPHPTEIPPGFVVGVQTCHVCGPKPITATLTYPTHADASLLPGSLAPNLAGWQESGPQAGVESHQDGNSKQIETLQQNPSQPEPAKPGGEGLPEQAGSLGSQQHGQVLVQTGEPTLSTQIANPTGSTGTKCSTCTAVASAVPLSITSAGYSGLADRPEVAFIIFTAIVSCIFS